MIPRFRGQVGHDDDGKFYYQISIWNFEATEQVGEPFTLGPFTSMEVAREEGRKAIEFCIKEMDIEGVRANGYVDMKNEGKYVPIKRDDH